MDFIGILGDPGAGKTNMLVRYLYAEYKLGTPAISNMRGVKFPQTYMGFEELCDAGDEIMGHYVAMDELGIGADSYDFMGKTAKGITKFVAQIRKFHCRTAYTAQRLRMVAVRLRMLTDGYVSMSDPDKFNMRYPDGRRAKTHRDVCRGVFNVNWFDRDYRLVKSDTFNGRKYWPLYDTDERIYIRKPDLRTLVPDDGEDEDY